jgi:hypothetical protein
MVIFFSKVEINTVLFLIEIDAPFAFELVSKVEEDFEINF